jgi:hypothetical protein
MITINYTCWKLTINLIQIQMTPKISQHIWIQKFDCNLIYCPSLWVPIREMIFHHLNIQLFTILSMWQGGSPLYFIFGKWYLHITLTTTILTQDTLGWGPHIGPHPNMPCVSVVVVHKKCKYHFPLFF